MTKKPLIILLVAIAGMICAQEVANGRKAGKGLLTPNDVQQRRSGGFVTRMVAGKSFLFADTRKKGPTENAKLIKEMELFCEIPFVWRKIELTDTSPLMMAKHLLSNEPFAAVTIIKDGDADEPVLATFPEDGIAVINVTPLKDGVSESVFNDRFEKELWRSVAFAAGGIESMSPHCSLKYIKVPADLDALDCKMLSPEITSHITHNAFKFGFGRNVTTTYRNACREGWAPPPTNDYQKAIWDRVMAEKAAATNAPSTTPPAK